MIMAGQSRSGFSAQRFLTQPGPGKTFKSWPPKHTVFSQGDKADAVYYIQAGKVKLTVVSSQGKEAVVGMLTAEHFFGEQCLTGQTVRTVTATVLEEARIVRIARTKMIETLREEPGFSALFLKYVLSHSLRVEEDLVDQMFNRARSAWRECCCYWRILGKGINLKQPSLMSIKLCSLT